MKRHVWNSENVKALIIMLGLFFIFGSNATTRSVHATESTFTGVSNQTSGALTWSITPEGKLTITGTGDYARDSEDEYNGYNPSWYAYKDYIKAAEVNVTGITSMERMFQDLSNLTTVDFKNTDASQVTTMKDMFVLCSSLQTVNLSSLDTRNVKNMSDMFNMCTSMESVTVSGKFSTASVTDMSAMFANCNKLSALDVSDFDTSSVTDMSSMFSGCETIKTLDVSTFNTSKVTDMGGMFGGCYDLETLTLGSNFNVDKVKYMNNMFIYCYALTEIDLSTFRTSPGVKGAVTDMSGMFDNCRRLTSVVFPKEFDTSNVTDMAVMFYKCGSLEEVNLSGFDTSKVKRMNQMFDECISLTKLDISSFDTSSVEEMHYMFRKCKALRSLDLSHFDTVNVTSMSAMFQDCYALESLDISSFKTGKNEYVWGMFANCKNLQNVDVSKFDTSKVQSFGTMFKNCYKLQSIDVSNFNTSNATNMKDMFYGCNAITELDLSGFDTSNYTSDTEFVLQMSNLIKVTTGKDKRAYRLITNAEKWMDDVGNVYINDTTIEPESNTTLYAHNGVFNINYIYEGELVDCPKTYNMGEKLSLSGYVTKEHYTFDGWYEDKGLTKKITVISADRYGDITLYAKMVPVTYAITYRNVEDASKMEALPLRYTYGENFELGTPVKLCYKFAGWYEDEKLTKKITVIAPGTSGDIILYGKWIGNHDLDKENGTIIKEATTIAEGEILYKCKNCAYTETEKLPRIVTDESQITDEAILNNPNEGDIKGSDFTKFQARADKTTKKSIRLKWNKVDEADGYKIYGNRCGKKNRYQFIINIEDGNKTKWTQKKLRKGTYYKYIVRAYKLVDGEEVTLAVSKTIHATTTGGKYGVAKSVKVKTDKKMNLKKGVYTLTIKKNKKYTIKAYEVKGTKKIQKHRKIAFESSDKTIASVSSKGVVKAKKKGTCYIYAYAQNGVYKKIKVVVK